VASKQLSKAKGAAMYRWAPELELIDASQMAEMAAHKTQRHGWKEFTGLLV
jgi:hypothetical protein